MEARDGAHGDPLRVQSRISPALSASVYLRRGERPIGHFDGLAAEVP